MTDAPWIIAADGRERWRHLGDGSVETQRREVLECRGCRASVLTWPGEHERHWPLVEHAAGCRYGRRS